MNKLADYYACDKEYLTKILISDKIVYEIKMKNSDWKP